MPASLELLIKNLLVLVGWDILEIAVSVIENIFKKIPNGGYTKRKLDK